MEQHILKPHLQEMIAGRKVAAAVFHTFNFEPVFFENYVLPLLVPSQERFTNDPIANQILWRECIKNGEMPSVTVYFDDFAKNNAEAPMLGYEVRCIRLPEARNAICNFHPKQIFILLENGELIIATGSGNLTQAGWCTNVEAFHIESFEKPYWQRPFGQKGELQQMMEGLASLADMELSVAEQLIAERSLRYFSPDSASDKALKLTYFTNLSTSFQDFIKERVFQKEGIEEIEIISPFFSNNSCHIDFLKEMGVERLRFLLPVKDGEVLIEEATFNLFSMAGGSWHNWENEALRDRLNHAKIYRFHGKHNTYTIIGSVNFTTPAWEKLNPQDNHANIEAAVLYEETTQPRLLAANTANVSGMRFAKKNDMENAAEWQESRQQRNKPDIQFTIDWQARKMKLTFQKKNSKSLRFIRILEQQYLTKTLFDLDRKTLRQLARNAIIEVIDVGSGTTHVYYPNHEHFEQKPLPIRLAATNILQYWNKLGEEKDAAAISRLFADAADEDSGELTVDFGCSPSLLNEWALYFNGLVKLEKYLSAPTWRRYEKEEQEKNIKWYLLHNSYDTLPFFLDEIRQQYEVGKHYHSFYWMVLQIVAQNLYGHKWHFLDEETTRCIAQKKKELDKEANKVFGELKETDAEKWKWLCNQIPLKT